MSEDRQRPVTSIEAGSPLNWLCHLYIKRKYLVGGGVATGSAVAFGDRYLLTAGHNIYQDNSKVRGIEVRVGTAQADGYELHEETRGDQGRDAAKYYPRGIFRRMPFAHDYGVVRLEKPFATPSPFTFGAPPVKGEQAHFAGYPGKPHDGWTLHHATVTLGNTRSSQVSYDLKTFASNSGGPVWRMVDGEPQLVAIHIRPSRGRAVDGEYIGEVKRLISVLDQEAAGG